MEADGTPLLDASIRVTDAATGITRSVATSRQGKFRILFLPPGEYTVIVERLGHRPKRMHGVRIRSGARTVITASLSAARPPVGEMEEDYRDGVPVAARPGAVQHFSARALESLPEMRREVSEVGRLYTTLTPTLASEGLPARYTGIVVDGVPFTSASHPDLPTASLRTVAFPLSAFEDVELLGEGVDVELAGSAGTYLSGATLRGSRVFSTRVFGTWSGDALVSSRHFDPTAVPHTSIQGGVLLSGPIVQDHAAFVIGLEARRFEAALPPLWAPTGVDGDLIRVARDQFGVDLQRYVEPRLLSSEAITGSGRLDWRIGAATALQVRGNLATVPSADPEPGSAWGGGFAAAVDGRDLSTAVTFTTEFDEWRATEIRVGYESSVRDYGPDHDGALPNTRMVLGGFAVGADPGMWGRFEHSALHLSQALHFRSTDHRLKLGLTGVWNSHEHIYAYGRRGAFVFADPDAFSERRGEFVQLAGEVPRAPFSARRYGFFVQDQWRAAPGLEVTAGLRFNVERLPAYELQLGEDFPDENGIRGSALMRRQSRHISPRFALAWDVHEKGRWLVDVTAARHRLSADPAVLAELLTHDGRVEVHRSFGELASWPVAPEADDASAVRPRLSLPGSGLVSPRTSRVRLGVTHHLAERTSVSIALTSRHTDFLPRRVDLNRLELPAGEDQFGRPIYGGLLQDGGLLVADPASNRRVAEFDLISLINPDGRSRYVGATIGLERRAGERAGFFASYTRSRTTDNWLSGRGGGPEAQLDPFPDGLAGVDWTKGRSDFDVPHRFALAGELRLPAPLDPRIAAVYRFRSGYPFTPGFRDGVDVNADGSGRNDPAFVDETISGVDQLMTGWSCLRAQAGRFARRNSCREPGAHALDLRLALGVLRSGRYSAELVIDGLNLVEPEAGLHDRALYLVAPGGELGVEAETGAVTIPLVANEGFGQLLSRHTPGRALRLGFRLAY